MADTSKIIGAKISASLVRGLATVRGWGAWLLFSDIGRREIPKTVEPRSLTAADQWKCLTDIVIGAASRAEDAMRCHASATVQLDLAQYALTSLVDELSAVMDMGGRRRRATVHVLGVIPSPSRLAIGDAIAA